VTANIANGAYNGQQFTFHFGQDVGNEAITWAAHVKFAGGTAPVLSTAANAVDTFSFEWDRAHWVEVSRLLYRPLSIADGSRLLTYQHPAHLVLM
jgi:hypothetical protein